MLRIVLIVLYLAASSMSLQSQKESGMAPSGLTSPPAQTDGGSGCRPPRISSFGRGRGFHGSASFGYTKSLAFCNSVTYGMFLLTVKE